VGLGYRETERERDRQKGVLFNNVIVYYNIASAVYDSNIRMEKWWNDAERRKPMYLEKIMYKRHSVHHTWLMDWPDLTLDSVMASQ
jgi:hypothetical protein